MRLAEVVDDALDVGAAEDVKVLGLQLVGPAVKDLDNLGARVGLREGVGWVSGGLVDCQVGWLVGKFVCLFVCLLVGRSG